jgi:hypothetical protein
VKVAHVLVAVSLVVLGPHNAPATDNGVNTVTLNFGEVWQGPPLEPCVFLKNTSSRSTRILYVQPAYAGAPTLDLTLNPGEQVVQPLPPIHTLHLAGPIEKRILLLADPPVRLEVALQESCKEE